MLAKVFSAAVVGLDAVPIEGEINIASQGLPSFTIVGLPDKAVERVRSVIRNSGADFPARRITINLAPADLHNEGPRGSDKILPPISQKPSNIRQDKILYP